MRSQRDALLYLCRRRLAHGSIARALGCAPLLVAVVAEQPLHNVDHFPPAEAVF